MNQTKFIGIVSGKGGVGKTTTSINLATAFTIFGRDVMVLDANLHTPNISLFLGMPRLPVTVHHAINGKNKLSESVYMHPSGLKIIPGSISMPDIENIDIKNLSNIIQDLNGKTELVLLDMGSFFSDNMKIINHLDWLIFVTTPDLPCVTDTLRAIKAAEKYNANVYGVVVNMARHDNLELQVKNIETFLGTKILGTIPYDESVRESQFIKHPVVYSHPNTKSTIAFKKLASHLVGDNYEEEIKINHSSNNSFKNIIKSLLK
ncbi:cell division ATPase MinD [Nanoarchaeota archaeon]